MTQPETITDLRTRRDAALTSAIAANERLRALDAAIARAQRAGESDAVTKLEGERADATRAGQTASAEHARLAGEARSSLVEWVRQSPEDTVAACSDQLPFVLLPVRMETKFARVGDTAELRVRLFPDEHRHCSAGRGSLRLRARPRRSLLARANRRKAEPRQHGPSQRL
jgi:hypothetical protein